MGSDSVLLGFLDDLRRASSLAEINVAAGEAYYRMIESRKRRGKRHLLVAVAVVFAFCAFAMVVHPGTQLDSLAGEML